ncbi:MAG: hypothetical protein E6J26_05460 [Chloroflexi bacterium]|nr:MAG: hypothetical protein E6J26_05460 [Chloroflexota bacterium]
MKQVHDTFAEGALPYWNRFAVGRAWVQEAPGVVRFAMGPAPEGGLSDAELNDFRLFSRGKWPWHPPLRLTVRARASHDAEHLVGTAGFGFWNAPFALNGDAVDSPKAVWFFHASPPSYMSMSPAGPGCGWRAQVLNAPSVPAWSIALGNLVWAIAPLRPLLYRAAQTQVGGGECLVTAALSEWHVYRLEWLAARVDFWVDDQKILSTPMAPRGPLGFVAWIDNSMLRLREGEFAFANLAVAEREWLELSEVRIESLETSGE